MDGKFNFVLVTAVVIGLLGTTTMMAVNGQGDPEPRTKQTRAQSLIPLIPTVVSGDNVYAAWWSNKTGNDEVMFRASNDAGASFADKINLSNSTGADSQDVEIAADGDNVIVTWWERNQTAEEPVARISIDNGVTFGPILRLATNGTIGGATE